MHADIQTMLFTIVASSIAMALAMMAVCWDQRSDGVLAWAMGLLLSAAAYLLFGARPRLSPTISVVLGNTLLTLSLALMQAAISRFQSSTLSRWPLLLPILLSPLLAQLLLEQHVLRLTALSACLVFQTLTMLWMLRPSVHQTPGRGSALLRTGLAGLCLVLTLHASLGLLGYFDGLAQLRGKSLIGWSFLLVFLALELATFGFVFMTRDRLNLLTRQLAVTDALTGVANRRSLILALTRDMARAQRLREPYALLMLDIDHFKSVNDTHGHQAGDAVLRHMVAVVRERLRAQDTLGRYGGEEFLVLLPHTDSAGAHTLAETLRHSVAHTPCLWEGRVLPITISVGVWGGMLQRQTRWDTLVDAADRAMYLAKNHGRNRVETVRTLRPPSAPLAPQDDPRTFPASLQ